MLKCNVKLKDQPSYGTLKTLHNPPLQQIDIVDLLRWAYQVQRVDEVMRRIVPTTAGMGYRSNGETVLRTGCLGVVSGGGGGFGAGGGLHLPDDAERVHDAVLSLPKIKIGLVIEYAKAGAVPDWMPGAMPMPRPVLRPNGKPQVEYHDVEKRMPAYCLLRYEPDPDHLAFVRETYALWWDGIAALAGRLRGLDRFAVTGPMVKREPWNKGS